MGGEDPDKNIAEGYIWDLDSRGDVIKAPKTKRGKIITALLTAGAIAGKVAEVSAIGPLAYLIDAVIGTAFGSSRKSKRSATAKKMFGEE